ncbi:uncharacterized protein LOC142330643 [Lycorma delicatula]|uniref:uncharacterized protein LOC142330643 n=1 Tax=Lycorma delicatula TaxID=130591 RepID=UPI003F50FABA
MKDRRDWDQVAIIVTKILDTKAKEAKENGMVIFMVTLMVSYGHSEDNSDSHDANNNQDDQHPPIQLDPKLRRALLRVLNKLEEQDRTTLQEGTEKEPTNQTSNILNEYDFARYFNNKDTEQIFGSTNLQNDNANEDHIKIEPRAPVEEIKFSLYHSTDDENQPDFRTGGTFTREIPDSTIEEIKEPKTEEILFDDKEKYPSTNPTPQEAIFFQVPHPIEVPDAASDKPFNDSLNVQETQYLQTIQSDNSEFESTNKKGEIPKIVVENIQSENEEIINNNNDDDDDVNKDVNSNDKLTNSTKNEKLKHTVEFLHAPLLAAFTVQQDQLGLPKRVIPLNYKNTGAPLLLLDPQEEIAKQKELEEKRIILEQELIEQQRKLKILQLQQLPLHQNSLNKIQEETARYELQRSNQQLLSQPQIYDDQLRNQQQLYLQNQQRQFLESQEREKQQLLLLEQAKIRQQQQDILLNSQQRQEQERLKLLQQQEENQGLSINFQTQYQQPQPQDFQFQKSVDFQFRPTNPVPVQNPATSPTFNNFNHFPSNPQQSVNNFNNFPQIPQQAVNNFNNYQSSPSVELNRVNRGESSRFVGNSGFNNNKLPHNQSPNHDSQLQNLIFHSGITNELPTTHEDLNIVSKVLSLNHETKQEQLLQQLRIRDGPQQSQFIPNDQKLRYNQQNHFQTNNQQQIQQQVHQQQPQQINVQQFRSNEQQFSKPNDLFRSNVQDFRPNVQQFRSNEQQFRPNVQQHRSNNQFYSSQEFRASEQLFSEPSLKVNKIVKAPSILIEPPLP